MCFMTAQVVCAVQCLDYHRCVKNNPLTTKKPHKPSSICTDSDEGRSLWKQQMIFVSLMSIEKDPHQPFKVVYHNIKALRR